MFLAIVWRNVLSETLWMAFERQFNDGMFFCSTDSTRFCNVLLLSGAIMYAASADSVAFWMEFTASPNALTTIWWSASKGGLNSAILLSRTVVTVCPAAFASEIIV